jgi:hypothetical protein
MLPVGRPLVVETHITLEITSAGQPKSEVSAPRQIEDQVDFSELAVE